MSAIAIPMHQVDCRWLLALYAIIPACLGLVFLDALVLDGQAVLHVLPADPMLLPLWTVLFGLPHIIASLVTMADREYLQHYRHSLLWPLILFAGISAAGILGPQPYGGQALFLFLAFYTIYHVLAQQLGLTLMMMGNPPTATFKIWKWLAIVAGTLIYVNVYGASYLGYSAVAGLSYYDLLNYTAALLCAGLLVLAVGLSRRSQTRVGRWYLWGNVLMILSALLINELGYTLFVILIPRVIHDVTAYMIYISHDANRNRERPVNLVYRALQFTRLPPGILLPVVSVLIAFVLSSYQSLPLVSILVLTVGFLHYYFEGFIWRGPNPHRRHLVFRR
jgi:hypothetical protein